jgi:xylulose-5-phosphate/fructose-6-phosphate phosphoketolase
MTVLNEIDRFHLALDVIARVEGLRDEATAAARLHFHTMLAEHHDHIRAHGDDMPAIRNWRWPSVSPAAAES